MTLANQNKGKCSEEPIGIQSKQANRPKRGKMGGNQDEIGFSFASDWLIIWREMFGPIRFCS